jgi:hypothetical protein
MDDDDGVDGMVVICIFVMILIRLAFMAGCQHGRYYRALGSR